MRRRIRTFKIFITGGHDFGELYYFDAKVRKRYKKVGDALKKAEKEKQFIFDTLDEIVPNYASDKEILLINGQAWGVDLSSSEWCLMNKIKFIEYPAKWTKYGKAAGPIRNQLMLDKEVGVTLFNKPIVDNTLLIAFPGGKGTKDMTNRARKLGMEVIEVTYNE